MTRTFKPNDKAVYVNPDTKQRFNVIIVDTKYMKHGLYVIRFKGEKSQWNVMVENLRKIRG